MEIPKCFFLMRETLPKLTSIPPEVCALADYESLAQDRLDENAWAYIVGGAADELTLRANRTAFDAIALAPRVLVDFSGETSTKIELLGKKISHPIILAPIAYQQLAHPDGEKASALGAAATDTTFVVSTHASTSIEEIKSGTPAPLWFQLYAQPDRNATRELIARAETAGYEAIVVTVDAPVNSPRNREQRARFALPPGIRSVNTSTPPFPAPWQAREQVLCGGILAQQPSWKDLEWIRSCTNLPILLKGILHPDDAKAAVAHGLQGLIVSNHGGRTVDTAPASIHALPVVARAVNGKIPILLDGGVRRGTDVLKALALGANAVLIGRPYIFGLAAAGAVGVAHVVNLLRAEFEVAMALTGCRNVGEIGPQAIWSATPPRD